MRVHARLTVLGCLAVLGSAGLVVAPVAGADCNYSSGTTVCSQGQIRGTHAPPPTPPHQGAYGSYCTGGVCFGGFGFGFVIGS